MNTRSKIFVIGGVFLLAAGGISGILFQKYVTVGTAIRVLTGRGEYPPSEVVEQGFTPVDLAGQEELFGKLPSADLKLKVSELEKVKEDTIRTIDLRLPKEDELRQDPAVVEILSRLTEARSKGEMAELEYRHNRVFRDIEIEYFTDEESWSRIPSVVEAISGFSDRLKSDGVHLIYCPVPSSLDSYFPLYSENRKDSSFLPEHSRFLLELLNHGVDVIDLRPEFRELASLALPPFHRFDHHWTPAAIEKTAGVLAAGIHRRFEIVSSSPDAVPEIGYRWKAVEAPLYSVAIAPPGTEGGTFFVREVTVNQLPVYPDSSAPIWIMGDSMVHELSPQRLGISGGITSHLAGLLRCPAYGLVRRGSTDIRKPFFLHQKLTGHTPKLVIWIHASFHREFETFDVAKINFAASPVGGRATILEVSQVADPKTAPYPEAIVSFSANLHLRRDQQQKIKVLTWAFRGRKKSDSPNLEPGAEHSMQLVPWIEAVRKTPSLSTVAQFDDIGDLDLPIFWWDATKE